MRNKIRKGKEKVNLILISDQVITFQGQFIRRGKQSANLMEHIVDT